MRPKYSVFVSSPYRTLMDERHHVIDAIIKMGCFPIAMENITFGSFEEIMNLIDISDIVILLLGGTYGTTASDGVSWTEKEFEYAKSQKKHIFALELPQLSAMRNKTRKTADERKQMAFVEKVGEKSFLSPVRDEHEYFEIISTHFLSLPTEQLGPGWERRIDFDRWLGTHPWMDVNGLWYSFHVSNKDTNYLKIGTVKIEQAKDIGQYRELNVIGNNYRCRFDPKTNKIEENDMTSTTWKADYEIYPNSEGGLKEINGIFVATKNSDEEFADVIINQGVKMGIHIFDDFKHGKDGGIKAIYGRFSNVNAEKEGRIVLFRKQKDRDQYLRTNYPDRLNANTD